MFFFGDEFIERVTQNIDIHRHSGDMDIGDEFARGLDAQDVFKWRIGVDEERLERIKFVEFIAGDDAFSGDQKGKYTRLAVEREIADDADEDECDGHKRAIGIEGVGDDSDEENSDDDARARTELQWLMFRSLPTEKYFAIGGGNFVVLVG